MTRINATVPPKKLCDQHLIAEYREILRVFKLARRTNTAPKKFTLGTGHVSFFYDKLKYAHNRFQLLRREVLDRGFTANMEFDSSILLGKENLYNDWIGTKEANKLVTNRMLERAKSMGKLRYMGKLITKEDYEKMLQGF